MELWSPPPGPLAPSLFKCPEPLQRAWAPNPSASRGFTLLPSYSCSRAGGEQLEAGGPSPLSSTQSSSAIPGLEVKDSLSPVLPLGLGRPKAADPPLPPQEPALGLHCPTRSISHPGAWRLRSSVEGEGSCWGWGWLLLGLCWLREQAALLGSGQGAGEALPPAANSSLLAAQGLGVSTQ